MPRKIEFDYAKGIGAILVIFGHMTTYPREITSAIYSFHMPLFFVITGILIYNNPVQRAFKDYVKNKVHTILLPGLYFELVMYIWLIVKNVIRPEMSWLQIIKRFLGIFLQIGYSEYTGSLWYFSAYFTAIILLYFIWKLPQKLYGVFAWGLVAASYIAIYLYPDLFLPWHIEIVPACMGYILFGFIGADFYKRYHLDSSHLTTTIILGGGVAEPGICMWF